MAQARKKKKTKTARGKTQRRPARKKPAARKKKQTRKTPRKKTAKKTTSRKKAATRKKARPSRAKDKKKTVARSTKKKTPRREKPAPATEARPVPNRAGIGTFEELIAHHMPEVQETARRLRSIVHDVLPKAVETVYLSWRIAIYREPREICGIQPVRGRCNFYLTDGAHLADPEGLLQGTGKNTRYLRIFEPEDIPLAAIKQLIREGYRYARMGRPEPTEETGQS